MDVDGGERLAGGRDEEVLGAGRRGRRRSIGRSCDQALGDRGLAFLRGATPSVAVAEPWMSRSTSSTLWPRRASPAARLTAVVVLPTPPFWFAMQRMDMMRR